MEEGIKVFERQLVIVVVALVCFSIGCWTGYKYRVNTKPPVEEIIKADSLVKVNDSIKIKVEQLDSIKDAKIIEVQTLNNDSTIKLFYELISK